MYADVDPSQTPASGMDTNRKIIIALVVGLLAVIFGMYAWKTSAVSSVTEKMAQMETQQAEARAQLIAQARQLDASHTEQALRLFSKPFAWALRREIMASNLDQVDQYFTELVQLKGFQAAVLAKEDDKIIVASDRKQLAQPFSSLYPAQYLQADEVKIERAASGNLLAVIPILGLNQRLGTLVLEYAPEVYPLQ